MYGHPWARAARLALILVFVILTLCPVAWADDLVFSESFDDGNWTANPVWTPSPASPSVSISSERYTSAPYSLKIAANSSTGAIRTGTGLLSATQGFTCTLNLYVESIPDEGIPWCLQDLSNNIVAIVFLLPNGKVQLAEYRSGTWTRSDVPYALSYGQWHSFRVSYDGAKESLYVDGHTLPDATVAQVYSATPSQLVIGNFSLAHTGTYYVDDIVITAEPPPPPPPPGRVYVQFCSDTSTGGLGTDNHYNTFPTDDYSYTSPTGQAAQVMAESYRDAHRDSLGNTLKLTWYMNCGSIYSGGITTGPIFPYELMMDNHGTEIARWGDEMAYHYHTWFWDGTAWTQTAEFTPCLPDFEQTVAHFVLDRDFYPSSFRSGWNWMSNLWECYLDDWFPYRFEGSNPSGNWIPYHPSTSNWRAAGALRGWESLHDYTPSQTAAKIEAAFAAAYYGETQVMTLWSHLKETDFPTKIDEAHAYFVAAHAKYPTVEFEYLTGRECMLKWRGGTDTTPPAVTVSSSDAGGVRTAIISTNEGIYQKQPFVALMTTDGAYSRVDATAAGTNRWSVSYDLADTLKIAVGVTDWFGNASVKALPALLRIYDVLTSVTTNSAEITWRTSRPTDTALDWRLAPSGGITSVRESALTTTQHVSLGSLQPGQVYRIDIAATDESGQRVQSSAVYILTKSAGAVIIDNSDPAFSVTGSWATGTTAAGHYGPDYRYILTSPTETNTANWTWQAPSAGAYRISVWWSQGSNRSTEAKYSVLIGAGQYAKVVNQQACGGVWNEHGVYDLAAGQSVTVRLWNTAPSGLNVIADAVKFEQAYVWLSSFAFSRLVPDGSQVRLPSAIVTAVFNGEFYVQQAGGIAGIKVIGGGVTQGSTVEISGMLSTINGERAITNPIVN